MRWFKPPVWFGALVLLLALCWRMIGAPVTSTQWSNIDIPIRQAKALLPVRVERVLKLWIGTDVQNQETTFLEETDETADEPRIMVYLTDMQRLESMSLEGYVRGVIAAEMPVQYHLEALKAQAVAARTRALWQMKHGGCTLHEGADICTDSTHCQGYSSPEECRERWGESFDAYCNRLIEAQQKTKGQVITYEGELITVLYHAISGGRTEDVSAVFSQSLPYLISVESRGEEDARGFYEEAFLEYAAIAKLINDAMPEMHLTAQDVQRTFSISAYTEHGRVKTVQIDGQDISATDFRKILGLRSTWFSVSSDQQGITFHQRGYGHGVGMSQAGANSMASHGKTYENILVHYYPGVALMQHE